MANKPLKSIKFPELPDTYTIPQVDLVPTQGSANAVSSGGVYSALADKADAEEGKGLSTNDYTDAEKEKIANLPSGIEDVLQTIESVNIYDSTACEPQNGKTYNTIYGNVANSASYAITGKIPVEENTQYIFSTGGIAKVKYVCYYSGENGETYLSDETLDNAPFTTPSSCTFVAFSIFARTHTEEEFNSAIAVAQLEKGDTATTYVPYGSRTVYSPIASDSDMGKALKVKTVEDGRVVEWEYGESGGGGGSSDSGLDEIAPVTKSKNLYNPAVCNPQDGKAYNTSGALIDSAKYAVTGKIPVEPETEYIFSTGGYANPRYVILLGNDDGSRFIREVSINGASFTTTSETSYIDVELFATTHTTTDFENAIANSQLEKGNIATPYVPYFEERKVPTNKLVEGDAFTSIIKKSDNYSESTSLVNQYDKTLAVDGQYFNSSQSKIYKHANYGFSGYIPVKPNTQYNISRDKSTTGTLASYYQEWDADKTFIQETQQPYANSYISQIQTGATTHYITVNLQFGGEHTAEQFAELINTIMLVEGVMRPLEYSAYNSEPTINHEKIDIMRQLNADRFRGKKWLVTGTSVSYQDSKEYTEGVAEGELVRGYIGNVSRCKPMLIRNEGISGSTLADTTQSTALINRYQNLNMGSYDFITVEYGINDFGRNVPVGTAQDTAGTSTFAACLKTIIEYALAQNPIVGLIICTDPDVRGATINQNGNTLKDYADVTLEIAKQYRLPVCDWFYHSGINDLTKGDGTSRYTLTQAGTHPSVYGHMRMGAMLNQVFDSLLC